MTIPQEVRDELDQTAAWWNREYAKAHDAAFQRAPFNPARHEGHNVIEEHYFGGRIETYCTTCPTEYEPRTKEDQ